MTASTDFDRFLASVLDAEGPQTIDQELVDTALATARAVPQRRPIVRGLDRRAWPTRSSSDAGRVSLRPSQVAVMAALGLLLIALLAVAFSGAARPRPLPLADGERVILSGGDGVQSVVEFVDAQASSRHFVESRGSGGCRHVLAGTTIAATSGFGEWPFIDVTDGSRRFSVSTDYTGFEAWSVAGDRLALVDFSGSIGMVDFATGAPTIVDVAAPGVAAADWSHDGSRLALARVDGSEVVVDVVDAATGETREAARVDAEGVSADAASGASWIHVDWGSRGDIVALHVLADATAPTAITSLVDLASGSSTTAPISIGLGGGGIWSFAGDAYATLGGDLALTVVGADGALMFSTGGTGVAGPFDLRWSPTGDAIAGVEFGGSLRVFGRDGRDRGEPIDGVVAFSWSTDASALVVAQSTEPGMEIVGFDAADMSPAGVLGHAGPFDTTTPVCVVIDRKEITP